MVEKGPVVRAGQLSGDDSEGCLPGQEFGWSGDELRGLSRRRMVPAEANVTET
jgi:hypothetical protein